MIHQKILFFVVMSFLIICSPFYVPAQAVGENIKQYPMLYPVFEKGKWGYIDKTGKLVVPMKFSRTEQFSEGMGRFEVQVKKTKKGEIYGYGFVDASGKIVVKPTYSGAGDFNDGVARVTLNKSGFVDKNGSYVIPLVIGDGPMALLWGVTDFSDGLAVKSVLSEGRNVFIDKKGNTVGPVDIHYSGHNYQINVNEGFSEGYAVITNYTSGKSLSGYIDKKWNVVIAPEYDSASPFHNGVARVAKDGNIGYIDSTGNTVIELKYDYATDFSEGLASVQMNGEWHVIDRQGNVAINQGFKQSLTFAEGLAPIQVNTKWGYINTKGEMVIKPQFTFAREFRGGVAQVNCDGAAGICYINTKGQYIWKAKK